MTEGTNIPGLAWLDGTSAKSNARPGAVARSRLAGAGIAFAIVAMTTLGAGPAAADTFTGCLTKNGKLRNVAQGGRTAQAMSREIHRNNLERRGAQGRSRGRKARRVRPAIPSDILEQLDNVLANRYRERANFVFVTSTKQTGDLGGIDGADDICNDRAADAGLPGGLQGLVGFYRRERSRVYVRPAPLAPMSVPIMPEWPTIGPTSRMEDCRDPLI